MSNTPFSITAQDIVESRQDDMSGVAGDGLGEGEFAFEGEELILEDEPLVRIPCTLVLPR